ncbi:MAG: lytic transglycosylase domain-containing protein, partial [Clostridia bacterium]|nr:lytic transglycosylase domain-containing protein [Clostridia bacterium]
MEIERACEKYGVKKEIVLAVIRAESNFRERAISRAGAVGLMQIMPDTARFIADKIGYADYDLFFAADNVELGAAYLKYLFEEFSSENVVFAAYNAGEG